METCINKDFTAEVNETLAELKNAEIGKANYHEDLIETVRAIGFMIDELCNVMDQAGNGKTGIAKELNTISSLLGIVERKIDIDDFALINNLVWWLRQIDLQTENN